MRIFDFEKKDVESATRIALANYNEEREYIPILDSSTFKIISGIRNLEEVNIDVKYLYVSNIRNATMRKMQV